MSELVFNPASNDACNGGENDAAALVATFVETLAELDDRLPGPVRPLKLPVHAWDLMVTRSGGGVPISLGEVVSGFYQNGLTRDLAAFFDALQCHAPAVEHLDDAAIDAILRLTPSGPEIGHEGVYEAVCEAGYEAMQCVVTGGTLVSFAHERWNFDHAAVTCDGQHIAFDHASRPVHVDAILARGLDAARDAVTRRNFEAIRDAAFPSLAWGRDVAGQMATFPSEYIRLAFTRLASLDDMARRWRQDGSAEPDPGIIELRPESELTMQNYGQARRFRSAEGTMKTYETHIWIDRGNRVHLFLDRAARVVEIGYIGPHLPTWNH